jgi:hypothetical protein
MRTTKQQPRRGFGRGTTPARRLGRGRASAAPQRGGGAAKGAMMAAAPVVGGLLIKKLRTRQKSRRGTPESVSG